jgi:hypothetical protein
MTRPKRRKTILTANLGVLAFLASPPQVLADEGGVGFWLPGTFGNLAAVRSTPAGRGRPSTITVRSVRPLARSFRAVVASMSGSLAWATSSFLALLTPLPHLCLAANLQSTF